MNIGVRGLGKIVVLWVDDESIVGMHVSEKYINTGTSQPSSNFITYLALSMA
jgi:hypothetical protein